MAELDWIDAALVSARPQAVAALLRYFRDLELAEEAYQDACLRALKSWPKNGPPRDPAAWLIMVGRNAAIDSVRKRSKQTALPEDDVLSDLGDAEAGAAERVDSADYRDDVLRLLFICCHPDLPPTQQVALALRIVSGLTVPQIARAFLVSESAMEQRITRAKAKVGAANVPFETPGPVERSERFAAVAAMIYLVFNEGYSAGADPDRAALCDEAIRLARLLLRMFASEPEVMGLLALMLLQHARAPARFTAEGETILLEDQDRSLWKQATIGEALALLDKAIRHRQPGPYQLQAAIAAMHARARTADETDWAEVNALYGALERHAPSPVVTLNRAVAVSKVEGALAALEMIAPLRERLDKYFYFHGVSGALLMQLGRNAEARDAFNRAIALANTPAEAVHIRAQLDKLPAERRRREKVISQCRLRALRIVLASDMKEAKLSEHELSFELILAAPAEKLFRCYTDPKLLQQWFAPKPWTIKSVDIDVRPGGRFNFVMASPEGQAFPNSGMFLAVEQDRKLVTTDAVNPETFEPQGPFMIAQVDFEDLGDGTTRYRATARHWTEETKQQHVQMGFEPGWTQTARQLEALAQTI